MWRRTEYMGSIGEMWRRTEYMGYIREIQCRRTDRSLFKNKYEFFNLRF